MMSNFYKKKLTMILVTISSLYLTFLVDAHTLNTPLKRIFIFCYFVIICMAALYLKNRFFIRAWRGGQLLSAIASVMIVILFHGSVLPRFQDFTIQILPNGQNEKAYGGEVWLTAVEVDGEDMNLSELNIEKDEGWVYLPEYDDYAFFPAENIPKDRLIFSLVAENVSFCFSSNAWAGIVSISDSLGNETEYDLFTENPEQDRLYHTIFVGSTTGIWASTVYAAGAFLVFWFILSVCISILLMLCKTRGT